MPGAAVDVEGAVHLELATKADLKHHHDLLRRMLPPTVERRYRRVAGSVASAGGGVKVLRFGDKPAPGWIWDCQYLCLFGDDPLGATIANVLGALCVGSIPAASSLKTGPPVAGLDLNNVVQSGLSWPSNDDLPSKLIVQHQEEVFVVLSGTGVAAGATFYHAVMAVVEVEDAPGKLD